MIAKMLKKGDTIGVVGVSDSLGGEEGISKLKKAIAFFEKKGFNVVVDDNVYYEYMGTCGTPNHKNLGFMNIFKNDDVKCVIALEGGQTCSTFVDLLDYEELKKHPKIFMGYSDVSVLLNVLQKQTGLITFHGPNFMQFAKDNAKELYTKFEKAFLKNDFSGFLSKPLEVIRKGKAKGKIVGTNMPCIMHLAGTEYFPDVTDSILFIEAYNITIKDCMWRLAQLKQMGVFDKITGIVVGYVYSLEKDGTDYPQLEDIIEKYTKQYSFPIYKTRTFGHCIVNDIIPIGAKVRIDEKGNMRLINKCLKDIK